MKILPAITTGSNWPDKIKEVKALGLKEVCLFPTFLNKVERERLYALLKDTSVNSIPFVHLRSDMALSELDYLVKHYQTKIFNVHTKREYPALSDYGKYQKITCIENVSEPFDEEEIKEFGGICLDISHLENDRLLRPDIYQADIGILKKHLPKCSHVAAIKKSKVKKFTTHYLEDLSELDYLKRYPLAYFGKIAALELENNIKDQLVVQQYILKNIINI